MDDISLLELNLKEATKLILGPPGSTVSLRVQPTAGHGGNKARTVSWASNKLERVPQITSLRCFKGESWAEARTRAHLRLARQSQCGKDRGTGEDRNNSLWPAWRPVVLDSLPKMATSSDAPADAKNRLPPLASLEACDAHGFSNGAIIQSLVDNDPRLTSLNLDDISLGSARTCYMLQVLAQRNTTLTSLKLGGGSGAMSVQEQVQQVTGCVSHCIALLYSHRLQRVFSSKNMGIYPDNHSRCSRCQECSSPTRVSSTCVSLAQASQMMTSCCCALL